MWKGTGALSGIKLGDIDLKNSGVYGAKVGYFMPRRLNWLGLEMEGFNTTAAPQGNGLYHRSSSPCDHVGV